jgi:hypothetical protein
MMGTTSGDFILFDSSADELYFEDQDLAINEASTIIFRDSGNATDWSISSLDDEVLLFLPVETTDDQSFNIGNATYTADVRIFGTSASTVVYDSTADIVIYDAYDIRLNDDDVLNFGDSDETSIQYDEDGTNTLQIAGVVSGLRRVTENVTANDVLTTVESGTYYIVDGNTVNVQLTLPAVGAGDDGIWFTIMDVNAVAASDVHVEPGTGDSISSGGANEGFASDGADKIPCVATFIYNHSNTTWYVEISELDTGTAAWAPDGS